MLLERPEPPQVACNLRSLAGPTRLHSGTKSDPCAGLYIFDCYRRRVSLVSLGQCQEKYERPDCLRSNGPAGPKNLEHGSTTLPEQILSAVDEKTVRPTAGIG